MSDAINITAKVSVDTYSEIQEERRAVGSVAQSFGINEGADGSFNRNEQGSGYLRKNINSSEVNYDLLVNFKKDISNDISFSSFIGGNVRRTKLNILTAATNGGLKIPGVYSLQNSTDPLPLPKERDQTIKVQGVFASTTFGYEDFAFFEATVRPDKSSTLPKGKNSYFYPSFSGSYLFKEHLNFPGLFFGKLRANYAVVGKDTSFDQISDIYTSLQSFNGNPSTSVATTKKNSKLRPELSKSIEAGIEMRFLEQGNIGFDFGVYKTNTTNQIVSVSVSQSTGYAFKVINAGEIENKGVEMSAFGEFDLSADLKCSVNLNWSKNKNKVVSLVDGLDEVLIGSFGVQVVAKVGALIETDYVYHSNGGKIVKSNGRYQSSKADQIIGNGNPDWLGGVRNTLEYKNFAFSFFIDIRSGGHMYSLDQRYGQATGVYAMSFYTNDLGNPVRNSLANGGGFIYPGVLADGTPNTKRLAADRFGNTGYRAHPRSAFVYDASFVKLREVSLRYQLPQSLISNTGLSNVSVSLVGTNLWIISKNSPYADPETGFGSGNIQGISSGSLPTTRDLALNVKLQF